MLRFSSDDAEITYRALRMYRVFPRLSRRIDGACGLRWRVLLAAVIRRAAPSDGLPQLFDWQYAPVLISRRSLTPAQRLFDALDVSF